MKKKYLVVIIILLQLLFISCGPQGNDRPIAISFDSLNEFKGKFSKFIAYPSYIPFSFDSVDGSILYSHALSTDRYKNLIKEEYNRIDIFTKIRFGYYIEDDRDKFAYSELYKLVQFYFAFSLSGNFKIKLPNSEYELLEYDGVKAYYEENVYSMVVEPEKVKDSNQMSLNYYVEFDKKIYEFYFHYEVNKNTSKEEFLELRDKLKMEALKEVVKSYKSMKYENID